MKANSFVWQIIVTLLLGGCANSTFNYTPPSNLTTPKNEVIINEPFERVWDRLVKNLSADFFVINNIEKASRLMNVSFGTTQPDQYVDCGQTRRTFSNIRGEQLYNYASAGSAYFSIMHQGAPFNISRKASLDGRSNIYVAPEGAQTVVRVNTRYIVTVNINAQPFAGGGTHSTTETWAFNTKDVFAKQLAEPGVTLKCVTRGILEDKILQAAKSGS